jgi:tRNA(Ile)-lysidine synthase TilS/MesJ
MNESESRRPCLRCLLSEIDEEAYRKNILRVTELMKASEKASDQVKERRLAACRVCDYLESGTCRACGCYVELRAALKGGRCPYKKWS